MILKISVHDNDFTEVMERFCEEIATGWHHPKERESDLEEKEKRRKWHDRFFQDDAFFRKILSKPSTATTEDEKERVIQIVTDSFIFFTNERNEESAEYLQRYFTCEIVDAVTDEWENGEVYYVFPTSYSSQVLCF